MPGLSHRVVGLSLSLAAATLPIYLLAVVAPQLERRFGVNASAFGILTAVSFAAWSVSALVLRGRVDRVGGAAVLHASILFLGAALLLLSSTRSWTELLVAVAVCGLASGAIPQASYRSVWESIPSQRKGLAFGLVQSGFPVGAVLTGVAGPSLADAIGWRGAFLACAGVVFAIWGIVRTAPKAHARPSIDEDLTPITALAPASSGEDPAYAVNGRKAMPLLLAGSVLANGATGALTTYLVLALVRGGVSQVTAGRVFALSAVAAILARTTMGHVLDITHLNPLRMTGGLLLGGSLGVVAMTSSATPVLVAGAIVGVGIGWGWSGLLGYTIVHAYADRPGAASGLVMTVAGGLGAGLGPMLMGLVVAGAGYRPAEIALGCTFGVAACVLLAASVYVVERPTVA